METMKKVVVLIMTFVMLFTFGNTAFCNIDDVPVPNRLSGRKNATAGNEVLTGEYAGILKILRYLDILTEEDVGVEASKEVERGYVATILSRVINPLYKPTELSGFSDVSKNTKNADGIYSALEQGIISKTDKFYPSRIATCDEAIKMAMNTLGYIDYPDKFKIAQKAKKLNLYRNVGNGSETLTMGQLVYLIKNMLEANASAVDMVKVDGEDIQICLSENSSSFIERKDIVLRKGIVTAQKNASMFADSKLRKDEIEINRLKYQCESNISEDLFGKTVYAYIDITNGMNLLISVWEVPGENHQIDILGEDIVSAMTSQVSYINENGKTQDGEVSQGAVVIYNNQYYGSMKSAINAKIFDDASNITLISNDDDTSFDVIKVERFKYVVVNAVSTISEVISLMYDEGKIDVGLNKDSFVLYTDGVESDFSALAKWDVLSVLEAKRQDGKMNYTIYSSRKPISGIWEASEQFGDIFEYIINGKSYKLAPDYDKYVTSNASLQKPVIGAISEFLISHDDKIVSVKAENEYEYAYLMCAGVFGTLDKVTKIKVFTFDGKNEELTCASKTTLYSESYPSGKKISSEEICTELYSGTTLVCEIVAYKTDEQGNISKLYLEMDTTSLQPASTDYPITKNYLGGGEGMTSSARLYANVLAGRYQLTGQTRILIVPPEEKREDAEEYQKTTYNIYPSDHYFDKNSFALYNVEKFYTVPLMVVKGAKVEDVDNYETTFMVSKVTKGIADSGEMVYNFYYYSGINETYIPVYDDAKIVENTGDNLWYGTDEIDLDDIQAGDIMQIATDSQGVGVLARILFKINNRGVYNVRSKAENGTISIGKNASASSPIGIVYGKIVDIEERSAIVNVSDNGEDSAYSYPAFISNLYVPNTYTLYDSTSGKVFPASLSEIQPGDVVVLRKRWNTTTDVFILR